MSTVTHTVRVINRFSGEYAFLSNFHRHPVLPNRWAPDGYQSNEHGFQALKTVDREQHDWVTAADTPSEAKKRGGRVSLRAGWHQHHRYHVMSILVESKFGDHEMSGLLLATGDAFLIEGNIWHDNTWGDCLCGRPKCVESGMNLLGSMLMTRRTLLANRKGTS